MALNGIGYMDELVAKRTALVAHLSPAAKHRAFPKLYARPVVPAKETRIVVNCLTGERTISDVVPIVVPPPPRAVPLRNPRMTTVAQIVEATRVMVEELWSVDRNELMARRTRTRDGERYAVYRLLRRVNGWSTPMIGKLVDRDHSSIVHGLKRAKDLYEKGEPAWRERYDEAARRLTDMKKSAGEP